MKTIPWIVSNGKIDDIKDEIEKVRAKLLDGVFPSELSEDELVVWDKYKCWKATQPPVEPLIRIEKKGGRLFNLVGYQVGDVIEAEGNSYPVPSYLPAPPQGKIKFCAYVSKSSGGSLDIIAWYHSPEEYRVSAVYVFPERVELCKIGNGESRSIWLEPK